MQRQSADPREQVALSPEPSVPFLELPPRRAAGPVCFAAGVQSGVAGRGHESLGRVSLATGRRVVRNEVLTGAVSGLLVGALVAVIAVAFSLGAFGLRLGAVIGVSVVVNLVIAGFFGATTPLVLDRLGYDPATSATIFITTATDVLGFVVFPGLAQLVLV